MILTLAKFSCLRSNNICVFVFSTASPCPAYILLIRRSLRHTMDGGSNRGIGNFIEQQLEQKMLGGGGNGQGQGSGIGSMISSYMSGNQNQGNQGFGGQGYGQNGQNGRHHSIGERIGGMIDGYLNKRGHHEGQNNNLQNSKHGGLGGSGFGINNQSGSNSGVLGGSNYGGRNEFGNEGRRHESRHEGLDESNYGSNSSGDYGSSNGYDRDNYGTGVGNNGDNAGGNNYGNGNHRY